MSEFLKAGEGKKKLVEIYTYITCKIICFRWWNVPRELKLMLTKKCRVIFICLYLVIIKRNLGKELE